MRSVKHFFPALLCLTGITVLSISSISVPEVGSLAFNDKLGHFFAYFVLTLLLWWGFRQNHDRIFLKHWIIVISIGVSWGILMEFAQLLLTNWRKFDVYDMIANVLGVFACWLVFKRF